MTQLTAENTELVFVYGTLMEGLDAHYMLKQFGVEKIGWGDIEGRLFDMGGFPALVESEDEARVKGELYRVPSQLLTTLDRYEGVPHLYRREKVEVAAANHNVSWPAFAWAYFFNEELPEEAPRIDGDYRKHLETPRWPYRNVPKGSV